MPQIFSEGTNCRFAEYLSHFGVSNVRNSAAMTSRNLRHSSTNPSTRVATDAQTSRGYDLMWASNIVKRAWQYLQTEFESVASTVSDPADVDQELHLSLSDSDNMSAEPEILSRESAIIRGSSFLLERGRTDRLFRSRLESSRGTAAIASVLKDDGRVRGPSGKHSNGTGVIENGIDLTRGSESNREVALPVWNPNQA